MRPAYSTAPFSMVLNLVLGLIFVLGVAIPGWRGFGFAACPIVTTAVEYVQLAIVFGVFCCAKQLHAPCEPENGWWSLAEVTSERVKEYAKMSARRANLPSTNPRRRRGRRADMPRRRVAAATRTVRSRPPRARASATRTVETRRARRRYVPAALSIASDFWRMSAVGAVAASLGKDDLGVFNASYRLMWMALTLTGSLGGAVATKLGLRLGAGDHLGARQGVIVGLTVACGVLVLISLLVIAIPEELAKIFTEDSKLIETFAGCRYEFAAALFTMNFAVVCERVPFGMGRARAVLVAGGLGSWAGQVPAVLLAVNFWQRSLKAVYAGVAAGYCLLIVLLLGIIATTDWKRQALEARARSEASG